MFWGMKLKYNLENKKDNSYFSRHLKNMIQGTEFTFQCAAVSPLNNTLTELL